MRSRAKRVIPLWALTMLALSGLPAEAQLPPPGTEELPSGTFMDRYFELSGYLRVRLDVLENFDLNHGPTPTTGKPLFPISAVDPGENTFVGANMRLRLAPTIRLGWGVSMHARFDILDNLVQGSTPEGLPASPWAPMSGDSTPMVPPRPAATQTSTAFGSSGHGARCCSPSACCPPAGWAP